MPKKLIHSDFELDLSNFKTTDTEENSWFSDAFSTKISYPWEIDLTSNLDAAFDFISLYNTAPKTLYNVKYTEDDILSDATFEIQEAVGNKLQCIYERGIDEFPSWDKKLSELSLIDIDLPSGTTIYQHATSMLNKVWPEVNYCFPAIHVNYYDTADDLWLNFEKIINNYKNGSFLQNTVDFENTIFYNKNIMQPTCFLLYLLNKIVEDAGFTLAGDILTDEVIIKKFVFSPIDYFKTREILEINISKLSQDYFEVLQTSPYGHQFVSYVSEKSVNVWGVYNLLGTFSGKSLTAGLFILNAVEIDIYFNGALIHSESHIALDFESYFIDLNFQTTNTINNVLKVVSTSRLGINDLVIQDLQVLMVQQFYPDGTPIPSVINEPIVNLKKAVPDMTAGELVTMVKNYHNYSFEPVDKIIYMNRIADEISFNDAASIEEHEIKNPTRRFQQGMSFLLKFIDVESKEFTFAQVFQNVDGYTSGTFVKNDKTNTIEINALPMPFVERSGLKTAYCFEKNESLPYLGLYDGLHFGRNTTLDPLPILLPAVHLRSWYKWFLFRINAVVFKWSFKAFSSKINWLNSKKKIYAYKNFHLIKSIIKTEIKPGLLEVEIETESIK